MTIQRINFLGLPLNLGVTVEDVCALLREKDNACLVAFINPQAWANIHKYPGYLTSLAQMSLVLPDGEGVARVCRWLTGSPCLRISFDMTSLAGPFFNAAIAEKASIILIGGIPGIAEGMRERLRDTHPNLNVVTALHGYGDLEPKIKDIMEAKPDVVIAGMGSPQQESFLVALRDAGYRGLAITCGGFFDQYLKTDKYYPQWINHWNLRFAWRLYKEPRRLWRRYFIEYQLFIWRALVALIGKKMPFRSSKQVIKEKEICEAITMAIQRVEFLGLPLDLNLTIDSICQLLRRKGEPHLIGYISPSSWAVARKYPEYLETLRQLSIIRPGGEGVACVSRWLTGLPCSRINFDMTSLADPFFKMAIAEKTSVMLIGGGPGTDENVQRKLKLTYPELNVVTTAHGFGDFAPKVAAVMKEAPDVVIAGMGSPRQESFLLALRDAGYRGLAITCGGFFDQYLEADHYYPRWIDRWNLRFAWRLYKEPRRLWRRYLIDYQIFVWRALMALAEKYMPSRLKRMIAQEKNT